MAREREIKNDFKIAFSLLCLAIPYIIEVFFKTYMLSNTRKNLSSIWISPTGLQERSSTRLIDNPEKYLMILLV